MSDKEKQKAIQDLLNRKRKLDLNVAENPSTSSDKEQAKEVNSDEGEKKEKSEQYEKAKQALLFDAKRAKDRVAISGPQGYLKPKSLATNKNFLRRTIESTLPRRGTDKK